MKKLLRVLLSIVLVLGLVYFFAIDIILKSLIEREGSRALAAKLDVERVIFHMLPTSIRLEGVQVTNPRQPERNLVEIAALETPLQLSALRERRLDIPEMQLKGLRFNTARAQSGAIPGVTPVGGDADAAAIPDSAQLALQQQQRMQGDIDQAQQSLAATLAKWRTHLQQLPDENRINEYAQRAQALRSAGRTAELTQLRQQLDGEQEKARRLAEEFELDMQNARAQLAYVQGSPQGADALATSPQVLNQVVAALLGAEFKPVLTTLVQQLDQLVKQQVAQNPPQFALLVRRAAIDGQLDIGTQPLLFTGTVENFTPQPRHWNVATSFALTGVPAQPSQFTARGRADLRQTASVDLRFDLRQFPLRGLPLSRNPQLGITVDTAVADIQGMLACTGNQVDLNLLSRFQQATLALQAATGQAANDNASQAMKSALQGTRDFDINLQVSGAVEKPTMKFDSSLTPTLAAALGQQLQGGAPTNPALQQQLSGVQQLANDFENLRRNLLARREALQNIGAF